MGLECERWSWFGSKVFIERLKTCDWGAMMLYVSWLRTSRALVYPL